MFSQFTSTLKEIVWTLLVVLAILGCNQDQEPQQSIDNNKRSVNFQEGELFFLSSHSTPDTIATLNIAVADEQKERNEGLMEVNDMPNSSGMLFIFPDAQPRSFWMANTPLSLDIIYLDKDKTIVHIHHRTDPYSQDQYSTQKKAKYVVETNGGFCQSYDIREGMQIAFTLSE